MKLSVNRFRTRRSAQEPADAGNAQHADGSQARRDDEEPFGGGEDGFGDAPFATAQTAPQPPAAALKEAETTQVAGPTDIEGIQNEGLTGRQLRLARRLAQRHGLPATSDFDAVRLLRLAGIDPFQRNRLLELVRAEEKQTDDASVASNAAAGAEPKAGGSRAVTALPADRLRLPQKTRPAGLPGPEQRAERDHAADLMRIQRDLARRRRRKSLLLIARLFVFVLLPTIAAGIYYYTIATPLYATKAEFKIDMPESPMSAGMGGLLRGTSLATSQDSIAVQGYLQSREAMLRLDKEQGFVAHFSDPKIDDIQRLPPGSTQEAAYKVYSRNVKIAYDPTEGILKLEVRATDPESAARFSEALISYAEEQVDHLSLRVREDQMEGAKEILDDAEAKMMTSQRRMVELQESLKVISSEVEVSLITAQIGQLETQLTAERLSLDQMRLNETPNEARMAPIVQRIKALEGQIAALRAKLTEDTSAGVSLASVQSELLVAQADVQTRQMLLAQAVQAMETARVEASRQVRYLSVSVRPVVPDEATYPRAFENTMVALLLFAGIYLMIAMTAEILREQVSA